MLVDALRDTFAFFAIWQTPLTLDELMFYLYGADATPEELTAALHADSRWASSQGYWGPAGEVSDWARQRIQRAPAVEAAWKKLWRWTWLLRRAPFLRAIYVCNNLALNTYHEGSDIDLFVVTQRDHVDLVRLWLVVWLQLCGVRRHGRRVADRFCLSFLVDETALQIPSGDASPDIYLSFWLRSLRPVCGWSAFKIWQANSRSLTEYKNNVINKSQVLTCRPRRILEALLTTRWGQRLEQWLRRRLRARIEQKREALTDPSGTVITPHMLKFHNHDRRSAYSQLWLQNRKKYQLPPLDTPG